MPLHFAARQEGHRYPARARRSKQSKSLWENVQRSFVRADRTLPRQSRMTKSRVALQSSRRVTGSFCLETYGVVRIVQPIVAKFCHAIAEARFLAYVPQTLQLKPTVPGSVGCDSSWPLISRRESGELPLSYTVDVDPWTGIASLRVIVPTTPRSRGNRTRAVTCLLVGGRQLGARRVGGLQRASPPRWYRYERARATLGRDQQLLARREPLGPLARALPAIAGVLEHGPRGAGRSRTWRRVRRWPGAGEKQSVDTTSGRMHFRTRDAGDVSVWGTVRLRQVE